MAVLNRAHGTRGPKRDVPGSAQPQPPSPTLTVEKITPPSSAEYVNIQKLETLPPSPRITSPQRWIDPKVENLTSNPHDQFCDFIEKNGTIQSTLKDFLERRSASFDAMKKSGDFSPTAIMGMAQFKQIVIGTITTYDQVRTNLSSPITKSEWWQEPEIFDSLNAYFQFFSDAVPEIDKLIAAFQTQNAIIAHYDILRPSTSLTQVVLEDFFTGIEAITSGDVAGIVMGQELIEKTMQHSLLLQKYEQITLQYQDVLNELKRYTSPLVGVDVPWLGYYEPEYPGQTGFNPSTLPTDHLNAMLLQKAYQRANKETWDKVFRDINHDPSTDEHKVAEMMADSTWDPEEKKFTHWDGQPWERIEKSIQRRAMAIVSMQEMIMATKPLVPDDGSLEESIRQTESDIEKSRKLVTEMETTWKSFVKILEVPEYLRSIGPISQHLNDAESAINIAAGSLRTGDRERAVQNFLKAQRAYVLAVETPHFNSLFELAGEYQTLSLYPNLGVAVVATAASFGVATMAYVGTEGLLLTSGATAMTTSIGAYVAQGATLSVVSGLLLNTLIDAPLPKGVSGWTYDIAINSALMRVLKFIDVLAKPVGMFAERSLSRILGSSAKTGLGVRTIVLGKETVMLGISYLFFAGAWTPMDLIGQTFMNDATFTPKKILCINSSPNCAWSPESTTMQGGFIVALRLSNPIMSSLLKSPYQRVRNYMKNALDMRIQSLIEQRAAIESQLAALPEQSGNDPATVMRQGSALTRQLASTVQEEVGMWSLLDTSKPDVAVRIRGLKGMKKIYTTAIPELQSMAEVASTFQNAHVQHLAAGIVSYSPTAQGSLQKLCTLKSSRFSFSDTGDGNFIFAWQGRFGETFKVTMVPTPNGPTSASTEIVPARVPE